MQKEPLVSIIIPVYNRELLIQNTLDSILSQNYTNWECILVDDGSTDASWEILIKASLEDSRLKPYKRACHHLPGGSGARNYGFELSSGELINWFDSDDLMHPDHLREKVQAFNSDDTLDIVFCSCIHFNGAIENTSKIWHVNSQNILEDEITDVISIQTALPMFRKVFLQDMELFPEDIHMAEEWVLFCRLLASGPKCLTIDKPLIYYRVHDIQKLKTLNYQMVRTELVARQEVFQLVVEHGLLTHNVTTFFSKVLLRIIRKAKEIRHIRLSVRPLIFILQHLVKHYKNPWANSLFLLFEYLLFILLGKTALRASMRYFLNPENVLLK